MKYKVMIEPLGEIVTHEAENSLAAAHRHLRETGAALSRTGERLVVRVWPEGKVERFEFDIVARNTAYLGGE